MEAHEGVGDLIVELAGDVLVVDVLRHGVVDVQQRHRVAGDARADVLAQRAVDVHLAGDRDAAGGQAGVDVARLKAELLRERRPALVRKGHILARTLVALGPVQQRQLKLRHALEQVGVDLAVHLLLHVGHDLRDACIAGVLPVGHQQVELGVLLDLHAQLVQALDRRVAGEEVLRTRAEGDDLEVLHADDGAGDRHELADHGRALLGGAHRILRDVGLQMAHAQVVGAVQHAAVGVTAAVDQVAVALGRRDVHRRAAKLLAQQRLGRLGAEVAQEDHQRIDAVGAHIVKRLEGVQLVFHGDGAFIEALAVGSHDVLAALRGERDGEAVAGDRDDAQLDLRNVHGTDLLSFFRYRVTGIGRCRYFLRSGQPSRRSWPHWIRGGPAATCCARS